jgi:hypothetical protein
MPMTRIRKVLLLAMLAEEKTDDSHPVVRASMLQDRAYACGWWTAHIRATRETHPDVFWLYADGHAGEYFQDGVADRLRCGPVPQ